jgi:transcriptional regulator with XRE-family HTH domain
MSIDQAIHTALKQRGLTVAELLARMPQRDRSTIYRLLSGETRDAKVSTLVVLCRAIGVTPNDLLGLAGLWSEPGRSTDPLDVRLRKVFAMVQALAAPYKLVAVMQVERLIGTWQEAASGLLTLEDESRA